MIAAPEFAREVVDAPATTTSDAALEIAGNATANATSGSLPMTGASSLVALGLAASLLAAGWYCWSPPQPQGRRMIPTC